MFQVAERAPKPIPKPFEYGKQRLYHADCFDWLAQARKRSISGAVLDPPYGLIEFSREEQRKMRDNRGIWRLPPAFDGCDRKPLPRFTVLTGTDRKRISQFFRAFAELLEPVLRPGAHVVIASNPMMSPLVAMAMEDAGFERRGEIVRLVRTLRGGDRPKNAEKEFEDVSTLPRSCWEPWGLYRKPISEKTIADNLRKWGTGGLRRISDQTPFLDVIKSSIAPDLEREIADHPSLKPQRFLRQIVRAILPLGKGTILDPFAGSGSTLAACQYLKISGVGVELNKRYYDLAAKALPELARLKGAANTQPYLPGL